MRRHGRRSERATARRHAPSARSAGVAVTNRERGAPGHERGRRRGAGAREPRRLPGRESLLAAAAALFAEHGYDAVTTRQILVRAGVEAPSLYHHFGSKLGLYRAVLAEGSEPFVARLAKLGDRLRDRPEATARENLVELVWAIFQGQLRNPETAQIALFEANRPGPRRYDLLAVWRGLRDVFRVALEAAEAKGELDLREGGSEVAANVFLGTITVYAQLHSVSRRRSLTRRLARQITEMLLDGIEARPARPGTR